MLKATGRLQYWAAAALVASLMAPRGLRAEDPGELFPNVAPYDETVSTPISRPEQSVKPATPPTPQPPPSPQPAPDSDTHAVAPAVPPKKKKPPRIRPQKPLDVKPAAPEPGESVPETIGPPAPVELLAYAEGDLAPMLDPDDQKFFEAQYAPMIAKALASSVEERKTTADLLDAAAQSTGSPDLKRYLLLHSFGLYIRAATPLALRVKKVDALLPLLKDRSLPVVQARADALNDLMQATSTAPNERFMDMYIDAHATLAKMQVQAGFPKEAQESIKKAREIAVHFPHKSQARIDQLTEAAAWCDRAAMAELLWPRLQAALKTAPGDPLANTTVATLHLSLYANLEHAAPFAAKSDRKDLQALAEILKANPPHALSDDPARHAAQVLAVCQALVEVAKATNPMQVFDRYSIACYAGDHVAQMLADGVIPPEKTAQAQALLVAAREIVDKTRLRRGDDLPRWLEGPPPGTPKIAAKPIATLADLLQAIPRDLMPPDMAWSDKQVQAINDWLAKNLVGRTFDGTALFDRAEAPQQLAGKMVVPVLFGTAGAQVKDDTTIRLIIEDRMSVSQAASARKLNYEQETSIKGAISSAVATVEGKAARIRLVVEAKE